jgi:hypothetical protein
MTVVLQHQFWDLKVTDQTFEVGLSFSGVPERLLIPFSAVTGFADPSVDFALKFETLLVDQDDMVGEAILAENTEEDPASTTALSRPADANDDNASTPDDSGVASDAKDGDSADRSADVVSLDAFRNKR